ncbi:MAG: polysaccharide deacetylase family protein [Lachnospiraceae bacterium]
MKSSLKHALYTVLAAALTGSLLLAGCGKHIGSVENDTQINTETVSEPTQTAESSSKEESSSSQHTEVPSETAAKEESTSAQNAKPSESSAKETPSESRSETEAPSESHKQNDWTKYSNEAQGWGQGVNFNSKNQPEGSLSYQKKYGSYDAHFIGSDTDDKVIWLTLDEGYENGYTSRILDVLKEKNCQAVFFITGPYAEQNPDLIRRMIDEGHIVGNHSWSHPSKGMPSLSVEDQIADITRLHDYVKEHFNYEMTLFRNPAGIFSERSLAVTRSLGYDSMFWSFAYADWDPDDQPNPQTALKKLVDRLHPGALYLLHAVSETNTEILGDFIDEARSQGYEFRLP